MCKISKDKIREFVHQNFSIHHDWCGNYIEADPCKIGRKKEDLIDALDKFINGDSD